MWQFSRHRTAQLPLLSLLALERQGFSENFDDSKPFAYDASKAAVNSFTVHLAHELRNTPVKVNSAHPGWVKTELGGDGAMMDITEGAETGVQLATLPADGPSGGFFHLGQPVPW